MTAPEFIAADAFEAVVQEAGRIGVPPRLIATATGGRVTILDRDALPLVTAALDAAG